MAGWKQRWQQQMTRSPAAAAASSCCCSQASWAADTPPPNLTNLVRIGAAACAGVHEVTGAACPACAALQSLTMRMQQLAQQDACPLSGAPPARAAQLQFAAPPSHSAPHLRCTPSSPLALFFSSFGLLASSSARACSCSGWPAAWGGRPGAPLVSRMGHPHGWLGGTLRRARLRRPRRCKQRRSRHRISKQGAPGSQPRMETS